MKKTTISLMVAAACAVTFSPAFSQMTINSASEIAGNSSLSGGVYWMDTGSYLAQDNAMMPRDTSIALPAPGDLAGFTFNGSLGVKGGSFDVSSIYSMSTGTIASNTYDRQYGLYLYGTRPAFLQEGGNVTLLGRGIGGDSDTHGTSTAHTYSYGLFIDGADARYVQTGGVMRATGEGASENSDTGRSTGHGYGLYIKGDRASYTLYGGEVYATGSTRAAGASGAFAHANAYGIFLDGAGALYEQYGGKVIVQASASASANSGGGDSK